MGGYLSLSLSLSVSRILRMSGAWQESPDHAEIILKLLPAAARRGTLSTPTPKPQTLNPKP